MTKPCGFGGGKLGSLSLLLHHEIDTPPALPAEATVLVSGSSILNSTVVAGHQTLTTASEAERGWPLPRESCYRFVRAVGLKGLDAV
jgi:hypothetical protein